MTCHPNPTEYIYIYIYIYCYAAMGPVVFMGAVRSRQVHQFMQSTDIGFHPQIQCLRRIQFFQKKKKMGLRTAMFELIIFFFLHKRKQYNLGKSQERKKSFSISEEPPLKYPYLGLSPHKI